MAEASLGGWIQRSMRVFGENAECKGVNIAIQYTVCDGNAAATMYWEPAQAVQIGAVNLGVQKVGGHRT